MVRAGAGYAHFSSLLMEHLKFIKAGVGRSRDGPWWSLRLSHHDFLFWNEVK